MAIDSHLLDLYRLRAEEYERNFHSLRQVEWQVYLQALPAFVGITAAYFYLKEHKFVVGHDACLALITIGLLSLIAVACTILFFGLQQRLSYTRKMQERYLSALHMTVGAREFRSAREPLWKHDWAWVPQVIL